MATRTVFNDSDNNELECYLNENGKAFISVGQPDEDIVYKGFITLDREDVELLIKILTEIKENMEE